MKPLLYIVLSMQQPFCDSSGNLNMGGSNMFQHNGTMVLIQGLNLYVFMCRHCHHVLVSMVLDLTIQCHDIL